VRRLVASIRHRVAVRHYHILVVQSSPTGTPCGPGDSPLLTEVCQQLCRRFGCDTAAAGAVCEVPGRLGPRRPQRVHRDCIGRCRRACGRHPPHVTILALRAALLVRFRARLALGIYQAVRAGRFGDVAAGNVALLVNSMPVFWLGLVLLLVLSRVPWMYVSPVDTGPQFNPPQTGLRSAAVQRTTLCSRQWLALGSGAAPGSRKNLPRLLSCPRSSTRPEVTV